MSVFALFTWFVTVFAGLYLLAIWLIEYDIGAPGGAVSRLPRTVISGHVLLAASGLGAWVGYLIVDRDMLAWIALAALVAVALLGFTMLGRWIMVKRAARFFGSATTQIAHSTRAGRIHCSRPRP